MPEWVANFSGVLRDSSSLEVQYASIKQIPEKYGHFLGKWPLVISQSVAHRSTYQIGLCKYSCTALKHFFN
jgi:hypothetical protein